MTSLGQTRAAVGSGRQVDAALAAQAARRPPGFWPRLRRHSLAVVGLGIVLVIILVAVAAPVLPLPDPNATDTSVRLLGPGAPGHLLGTDQLGRDLLSRLVWGARTSLMVGFLAAFLASSVGTLLGIVAGYYGGVTESAIMRLVDVLLAFPYLLLAIAIIAALGPGLIQAMIAVAAVNVAFYARAVRGAVLGLRRAPFVEAACAAGASDRRILFRHLLPNVAALVIVIASMNVGWMILETAGLSFLGLGVQPPTADWGAMLADGRQFLTVAAHVATIPGAAIVILVLALNLVGDGLRDALDPRLRR